MYWITILMQLFFLSNLSRYYHLITFTKCWITGHQQTFRTGLLEIAWHLICRWKYELLTLKAKHPDLQIMHAWGTSLGDWGTKRVYCQVKWGIFFDVASKEALLRLIWGSLIEVDSLFWGNGHNLLELASLQLPHCSCLIGAANYFGTIEEPPWVLKCGLRNQSAKLATLQKSTFKFWTHTDTEFFASAREVFAENLLQIVEGYVKFIKIKVWKPISRRVSTTNHCFKLHLAFYYNLMHL
jgi:hypothetical protein